MITLTTPVLAKVVGEDRNLWVPATVIGLCIDGRSYDVKLESGEVLNGLSPEEVREEVTA